MGIRGKFLYYAAGAIGLGFVSFLIVAILVGQLYGALSLFGVGGTGVGLIYIKQKNGLHDKKRYKGVVVYKSLFVKEY